MKSTMPPNPNERPNPFSEAVSTVLRQKSTAETIEDVETEEEKSVMKVSSQLCLFGQLCPSKNGSIIAGQPGLATGLGGDDYKSVEIAVGIA